MLNVSRYISTATIAESVARNADYDNVSIGDLVEWLWEVISYLNIPMYYIQDTAELEIVDYRGRLPERFQSLVQVRDLATGVPLVRTRDLFFQSPNKNIITEDTAHINTNSGSVELTSTVKSALPRYSQYGYDIKDGYIYTELIDPTIEIVFKAFPVDESGFPMVPEDAKFIRALTTYLIERLDYKAWRKGIISESIYRDSEQKYYYAAASAQSHSNMPDLDMMESMRRFSSLLISDAKQFNKSFKFLNR